MRSYSRIFFLILLLSIPSFTFAHGGVEKLIGTTIVFLNQTPLSPLVGEKVHLPFVFTDEKTHTPLKNLPVKVTVTDTFPGDESKDVVIYKTTMTTDVNGLLDFSYTFQKENYFDIDLDFKDAAGISQETGFLVQARAKESGLSMNKQNTLFFVGGAVLILVVLLVTGRLRSSRVF